MPASDIVAAELEPAQLFLFPIFVMILGFGNAEYVGPNGNRPQPLSTGGFAPAPIAP